MLVNRRQALAIGALVIAVGVVMAGCAPIRLQPPMAAAIRQHGADLELAVCEAITAERIYVGVRNSETDGDWLTLTELQGSTTIEPGSVLRVGDELPGMSAIIDPSARTRLDGEDFSVSIRNDSDALTIFFAAVPWDDLSGDWFYTDGKSSEEPC